MDYSEAKGFSQNVSFTNLENNFIVNNPNTLRSKVFSCNDFENDKLSKSIIDKKDYK